MRLPHPSNRRTRRLLAVAAVTAACGATLAGAGLARLHVDPTPAAYNLTGRVLGPGEPPNFYPVTCPLPIHSAERWAADNSFPTAQLRDNGFVGGLRERLVSKGSTARALSIVAQFTSHSGAQRELDAEFDLARTSATHFHSFHVTGIPNARGYDVSAGTSSRVTVSFVTGRFQYVVHIAAATPAQIGVLRARVLAAAQGLYQRTS
jgi:hypothetical protein